MNGAKSALEVKDDMTFLDLIIHQIQHLNDTHRADVPLLLMTSFNTLADTQRIVKNHASQTTRIMLFNQSRYPRILKETRLPYPKSADADGDKNGWYPPGHGDLYTALVHSGVLDSLLQDGKEYLFVSNSDNLGAVLVVHGSSTKREISIDGEIEIASIRRSSSTWLIMTSSS
jgi:UTP--glucose-1-phosphate uridylyltransferase